MRLMKLDWKTNMEDVKLDKIFKACDIRGVYPTDLNKEISYKLGQAIVDKYKCKTLIIGRDKRKSSPFLFKALVEGVISLGCDVIDIGYTTTPLFYHSLGESKADGGVMITASHNPSRFNGFKINLKGVIPLNTEQLLEIKEIVKTKILKKSKKKGRVTKKDFSTNYFEKILKYAKFKKNIKIVVDTSNAMSYPVVKKLLSKLPVKSYFINQKIDFEHAKHEANPLKIETLKDLQKEVLLKKADLGICFDGDGDRIGFVDEKGKVISLDLITAVISKELLTKKIKIISDLRSSKIVKEVVLENNGVFVESMVGHTYIKRKMREINAVFAGEVSGHYYFSEFYFSECPLLVLVMILNLIEKQPFSNIIKPFKKYFRTEEINFRVLNADKKIRRIKQIYSRLPNAKISTKDGLKVEYRDWWFSLRKSNTEDLLRLNLEADTKLLMKEKQKEVFDLIY